MNRSLELPEAVYRDLVQAAEASGKTPVGWIQERLPNNGTIGNGATRATQNSLPPMQRWTTVLSLGASPGRR